MGFVIVRVEGKTFPYRNDLKNELGLEYDWKSKNFRGAFGDKSKRLERIEAFCKKNRLTLFLDGEEKYNPNQKKDTKKQNKIEPTDLEDLDAFNLKDYIPLLKDFDDGKDIGKTGIKATNGHKEEEKEFAQYDVEEDTLIADEIGFDEVSKGTKFHPFRDIQKQVLEPMMDAIDKGYKNIVVEMPVGGGKSVVAKTIPQIYDASAYIVTHLKGLQAQYLKEMPFMRSVMGRGNYDCLLDIEPGTDDVKLANEALENATDVSPQTCNASLAPCKYAKGFNCTKKNPSNMGIMDFDVDADSLCDYYGALTTAQKSRYFVGNTAYMMGMNRSGKVLPKRPFLIVDEAHQLANNMMSFYAMNVSTRMLERLFKAPTAQEVKDAKSQSKKESLEAQRNRILKQFDPNNPKEGYGIPAIRPMSLNTPPNDRMQELIKLTKYLLALEDYVRDKMKDKDPHTKYEKKELSYASNFLMKVNELVGSIAKNWENWVYQIDTQNQVPTWISFKPLNVSNYADDLLLGLGKQRIFLTGTILDYEIFGRELGLEEKDTAFVKVHYSPFPEKNRPVYTHIKGGKLSKSARTPESFEKCADAIHKIASLYPDGKGLILPFTDDIEENIVETLLDKYPLVHGRLRQHNKNPRERDAVFREFETENNNEILISTYANQGFDGKMVDFTIIVKVPFGPLGDIQVKTKAESDPKWYQMLTSVELAQMCGRNVRSATDVGHTYIIDPSFMFHFERGMKNNPMAKVLPTYLAKTIIRNRK